MYICVSYTKTAFSNPEIKSHATQICSKGNEPN